MKKLTTIIILLGFVSWGRAQSTGIHFEAESNWQQIQAKAKAEHKYIFVDCFATWCGPCKQMDSEVYPDTGLGKFFNQLFISVKAQMDSSKNDNDNIRAWYADAHQLMMENKVTAYPTFLFFSPEGKLVHKTIGFNTPINFLRIAFQATDPSQQEYTLLERYKSGTLPDASVPDLINKLEAVGDQIAANDIAQKYISGYLLRLPDDLLLTKYNIPLLGLHLYHSGNKVFDLFYRHSDTIDKYYRKGYADKVIGRVIMREDVYPKLWSDEKHQKPVTDKPNWTAMRDLIAKKYNSHYADEALIDPQITWLKQHKQWAELISVEIKRVEKQGLDSANQINPDWYETVNAINFDYIFPHGTDKTILKKAISWQKTILDKSPQDFNYAVGPLDTYANLQYKLGDKKEALRAEAKAVTMAQEYYNAQLTKEKQSIGSGATLVPDKDFALKEKMKPYSEILTELKETLNKMTRNQPTWGVE